MKRTSTTVAFVAVLLSVPSGASAVDMPYAGQEERYVGDGLHQHGQHRH